MPGTEKHSVYIFIKKCIVTFVKILQTKSYAYLFSSIPFYLRKRFNTNFRRKQYLYSVHAVEFRLLFKNFSKNDTENVLEGIKQCFQNRRAKIIVILLLDSFLCVFCSLSFFWHCFVLFYFHSFIHSFIHSHFAVPLLYYSFTHTHIFITQIGLAMVAVSTLVISGIVSYTALCVTAWGYGLAFGCYRYTLKMLALERVRAKHFTKAWGKRS